MPRETQPPSKPAVFARRLLTSLILWTLVVSALFSSNPLISKGVFLGVLLGLSTAGLHEFFGMLEKRGIPAFRGWGMTGGLLLIAGTFVYLSGITGPRESPAQANDFETGFLILFVLGLCVRQLTARTHPAGLAAVSATLFALLYVPWLLNFIQKINFLPALGSAGTWYVLYFIVVTKFSDTGAYAVGSLIGRHKMIPRISPGKTWEGFAGALAVSTLASLVFAHFAGSRLPGMNLAHATLLGLLLGGAAVVGDLVESLFKREAGLKDSGRLFPGIGGILDLLDSLLFNAPLMYLYLRYCLAP